MQAMRVVDKFQYGEEMVRVEDGVQIISARHTVLKEPFTLKKIGLKEDNKVKYLTLINQIAMLKQFAGESVVKCHKMLKTSNNLYLVYDHMGSNTLLRFIEGKRDQITVEQKEYIASKLITILLQFRKKGIVNLSLNPKNIQIIQIQNQDKTQPAYTLRINNFQYGVSMNRPIDKNLIHNVPRTQFTAPQLDQGPIGYHCDVYSLGAIFRFIGISLFQSSDATAFVNKTRNERCQTLANLIIRMTNQNYKLRADIYQVKDYFQNVKDDKHSSILRKTIQRSKTLLDTQLRLNQSPAKEKDMQFKSLIKASRTSQDNSPQKGSVFRNYSLKILKKRNLAIFLLKCSHLCLKIDLVDIDLMAQLAFLFMKKSTQTITRLSKFLYTGRDNDIKISERQIQQFFKTQDYFKLQSLISKQMSLSKRFFNHMLTEISQKYSNLLLINEFKRETSVQKIDEQYFRDKLLEYLSKCAGNNRINHLQKQKMKYLIVMSYIVDFSCFQKIFEELINEEIIQLESQTVFVKLQQTAKEKMVEQLREKLKGSQQ